MSTEFTPLTTPTDDQSFADLEESMLAEVEGAKALPYIDSAGIPTVGIGVNLQVYGQAYLQNLDGPFTTAQQKSLLTIFKKIYLDAGGQPAKGAFNTAIGPYLIPVTRSAPYPDLSSAALSVAARRRAPPPCFNNKGFE